MWASIPAGGDGHGRSCEGAKGRGRLSGGQEKMAGLRTSRRRVRCANNMQGQCIKRCMRGMWDEERVWS